MTANLPINQYSTHKNLTQNLFDFFKFNLTIKTQNTGYAKASNQYVFNFILSHLNDHDIINMTSKLIQ